MYNSEKNKKQDFERINLFQNIENNNKNVEKEVITNQQNNNLHFTMENNKQEENNYKKESLSNKNNVSYTEVEKRKYNIINLTNKNDKINVPVKSAKTPYLKILKKQATPQSTQLEIKENDKTYVEAAKSKERIVFDEQHEITYKDTTKPQHKSTIQKIADFFCC
ncbi:hypothetical protein EHP00_154 [Ecytonucleospora hepatopenaei]|uniref:Uncharacterized protein n=1 Tax=Ecytonucleospora hepatopenaei TaxID=646526 RepID=A0A1W0E6J2_9MICR|nr:hypothetical protein EHP00_154 [Ecytonucleospora hepatopenaei]